jgi:hypothetical protein
MTANQLVFFRYDQFPCPHEFMSQEDADLLDEMQCDTRAELALARAIVAAAYARAHIAAERDDLFEAYEWVIAQPCVICDKPLEDPWNVLPDTVAALALGGDPPRYRVIGGTCDCDSPLTDAELAAKLADSPGVEIGEPLPKPVYRRDDEERKGATVIKFPHD